MKQLLAPARFNDEYERRLVIRSDISDHMPFLHASTLAYANPLALELGVRSGNSTAAFLAAVSEADGHLISVDIDGPLVPEWWWDASCWTFVRGSDTDPGIVASVMASVAGVDVLFIDTSHTYSHTLRELETWVPFVKPGGIVMMHDTEYNPAIYETLGVPQPLYPVTVAITDYCKDAGLTWKNRPGNNGLGVIHIPGG